MEREAERPCRDLRKFPITEPMYVGRDRSLRCMGLCRQAPGLVVAPEIRSNFEAIACEEAERLLAASTSAITFESLRSQRL